LGGFFSSGSVDASVEYREKLYFLRSWFRASLIYINPIKAELSPICHLLALLGAQHILHISG